MENQDHDSRRFLVTHKCGSIFTIELDTYLSSYQEGSRFTCPGCRKQFEHDLNNQLLDFLNKYRDLNTRFAEAGLKITEFESVETND
jgi:transposase-like protein